VIADALLTLVRGCTFTLKPTSAMLLSIPWLHVAWLCSARTERQVDMHLGHHNLKHTVIPQHASRSAVVGGMSAGPRHYRPPHPLPRCLRPISKPPTAAMWRRASSGCQGTAAASSRRAAGPRTSCAPSCAAAAAACPLRAGQHKVCHLATVVLMALRQHSPAAGLSHLASYKGCVGREVEHTTARLSVTLCYRSCNTEGSSRPKISLFFEAKSRLLTRHPRESRRGPRQRDEILRRRPVAGGAHGVGGKPAGLRRLPAVCPVGFLLSCIG